MLPPIETHELLNSEASAPGLIALYQRVMQDRTNEAMNGLSSRLDKIIVQAEKSGKAQGRQQAVMIALTAVLAVATVAYTATTIYATRATVSAQQAGTSPQATVEYVRGSGPVPESASVHMGTDEKGSAAVCINGSAYDLPASGDVRLKGRYPASPDGRPVMILKCKD
ncbi:hypothetical protein PQR75_40830 [Paraburkholderia fungorum]|uniref:hypothetical protein n=1 Tax=Paraburkholderia fungorum TaxID=134537 RepID=UPI0038B8F8CB